MPRQVCDSARVAAVDAKGRLMTAGAMSTPRRCVHNQSDGTERRPEVEEMNGFRIGDQGKGRGQRFAGKWAIWPSPVT